MQDHEKGRKRGHEEIQPRDHTINDHGIKEPEESPNNAEAIGQDRLITLPDMQGREILDHNEIIEPLEEFYTEVYDSEQSTTIHTDPKEVPQITQWEVEAALRDMNNGTATGNDHINIETLKAGKDTISETFAEL